jgi:hypothetical protein
MSDIQSNITLGREVELYDRVNGNDPANSAFIMLVLAAAGLVSDAVLKDYDTVDALLAGASAEVMNANYGRKTLTDADLAPYVVDDSNDLILLVLPLQTFASIGVGDSWSKACVAYDPDTTAGTDTTLVPVSYHDLRNDAGTVVIPNTFNIEIDFSGGWLEAS